MKVARRISVCTLIASGLAGCNANGNLPLVFVQSHTLGITANATGSQATPELTLGYRDLDVAVVPVIDGGVPLRGSIDKQGIHNEDALSVIGQFDAGAGVAATPTAKLGKFFATGMAAKRLADGFAHQLGAPKN